MLRFLAALLAAMLLVTSIAGAQQPPPKAAPVLVPPKLLSAADVMYPRGATGDATVIVIVTVNVDGTVRAAEASEPNEPFSSVAASVARTWKFEPATRDGRPVAAKIGVEIVFKDPRNAPSPTPAPSASAAPGASAAPSAAPIAPPPAATARTLTEVQVTGQRAEPSRTVSMTRAEFRQIPGVFGDPFRAIEVMPGVTPIVSGLPFFFVRGAPPGDVGYYLDGIRVPYLFHVGVGPSVIHPALIDRVDLYPGGYPARFGRFSGGIVSGETIPPSTELHGEYNIRLFDAGALVETPFDDGRGHALVGGRYSYTAALLTLLSSDTTLDYWDYQARVDYALTPKDKIGLFAFGASDYLGQRLPDGTTNTVFGAEFYRFDLRYDHRIDDNGAIRTAVTGGIDRTRLQQDRFLRDRMIGVRTELVYRLTPALVLRAGTDAQLDSYDIELNTADQSASQARIASFFPSRSDVAMATRGDLVVTSGPLQITPGIRFDFYGSQGATALGIDPRLATRTTISDRLKLLGTVGIAHQPPSFVVPVPGFQPGGLRGGLQTAFQESAGIEIDLGSSTIATATVFKNTFFDMSDALSVLPRTVAGCPPGTFPGDTLAGDRELQPTGNASGCGIGNSKRVPGTIGQDRSGGGGQGADSAGAQNGAAAFETRANGTAYGVELFLKRKLTNRSGGFLSYTLSRSTRIANGQDFIASFDRTHVLNTALAFDLGRNWRAGTRVTFYTGLPAAPNPTNPSATRLDPFFRLDLRLEKRWQLGRRHWISFVAEWMNATLSKESTGTSCTLNGCQETKIGPVTIPSIGVEGGF